jgi:hypothetical protein
MALAVAFERGRMSVLFGVGVEALGAFAKEARLALPSKPFAGGKHHFIGAWHAHANLTHWRGFDGFHLLDIVSLHRRPAKLAPRSGHVCVRGRVIDKVWMTQTDCRDCLGVIADDGLCLVSAVTGDVIE